MPKRYHLNRPDLAARVVIELRTCKDTKAQQRLLAARMAASGQFTAAQIAEQIGVSRRRFFDWMSALKAGGVEGLLQRQQGGGAVAQVHGAVFTELKAGLAAGRWKRAKEIQQWLRERHAVKFKLTGVYYWLGKLGGVLKVPRKTHARKDAAQSAEFQRTLGERLTNLNVAGGRRVRVWVADEHRYGLIQVVRRCWTLRGVRPTAPYQTKYEWGYLYSALEVDGAHAVLRLLEIGRHVHDVIVAAHVAEEADEAALGEFHELLGDADFVEVGALEVVADEDVSRHAGDVLLHEGAAVGEVVDAIGGEQMLEFQTVDARGIGDLHVEVVVVVIVLIDHPDPKGSGITKLAEVHTLHIQVGHCLEIAGF